MDELIQSLYDIIKDHREDEQFMSIERVRNWVNQFSESDRYFVLQETIHIFQQRYISQQKGREHVKGIIEFVAAKHNLAVADFISQSYFISNQGPAKSQTVLLGFLDNILQSDYGTSLANCNENSPSYTMYIDDILCTGETLVEGLSNWLNEMHEDGRTNYERVRNKDTKLILGYLAVHTYASKTLSSRLYYAMGKKDVSFMRVWDDDFVIDNDISQNDSKLNFLFPSEGVLNATIQPVKQQIEDKVILQGRKHGQIAFRPVGMPGEESLFSSAENRNRYEEIILIKSSEYYAHVSDKLRARPLGYGLNHDISFGFGTMIFTWRNVPFNTPLVFWYSYHGCIPLFERVFT